MKYDIYITLNIDDSVGWVAGGHVNAFVIDTDQNNRWWKLIIAFNDCVWVPGCHFDTQTPQKSHIRTPKLFDQDYSTMSNQFQANN